MDKQALRALLTEKRGLQDPERHGFERICGRQGRRAPGLSQHQVDLLLHRTIGTYHRLEAGAYPNPPHDLIRDVAMLFGLNEHEWVALYRYATTDREQPPGPLSPQSGKAVPGVWQEAVDGIVHMAYVTDDAWGMVAHNEPFVDMFPSGRAPRNTMLWMLCSAEARTVLTDWATVWAPQVCPQLRAAISARPHDETLKQLEKQVRDDPQAGPIYEKGGIYLHPDGDERPLNHATLGPGWVTMCAAEPMASPGSRVIILPFHPGSRRVPRPPLLRSGQ